MTMRRTYNAVIEIETDNDARWLEEQLRYRFRHVTPAKITHVEILEG